LNRELGANFVPDTFEHVARFDAENEWIEMLLRSREDQTVQIDGVDLSVDFATGELLQTEISTKFRREAVERELEAAGFATERWWTDSHADFALSLSRPR